MMHVVNNKHNSNIQYTTVIPCIQYNTFAHARTNYLKKGQLSELTQTTEDKKKK